MGCGSSREVATASSNNVFQKEVIAYILAEQPNGAIPQSEVARLTLCRGLHSHFRTQHMLQKLWRSYSNYNTCPTDASTMSFLQLQTLILDLLLCGFTLQHFWLVCISIELFWLRFRKFLWLWHEDDHDNKV